jgi:hypothetical protein
MTLHDRRRTHPVAAHAYTLPIVREVPRAQRELVAWSLLTRPDDRPPRDSR